MTRDPFDVHSGQDGRVWVAGESLTVQGAWVLAVQIIDAALDAERGVR